MFCSFKGFCQTYPTETKQSEERTAILKNAAQMVADENYQSDNDYTLPVTVHIFHNDDGSGGISEHNVISTLCGVFDDFSEYGISLYLNNIEHVNSTTHYQNFTSESNLDLLYGVENTINIMIINDPSEFLCATNFWSVDLILFYLQDNMCFNQQYINRMFGFYFGLEATFNGLQSTGNNCGTQVLDGEKVDGSNCTTAGDFICDTPPDYMSSAGWGCDANGEGCLQYDPDSIAFRPDGTNFMSASEWECKNKFTSMQEEVMKSIIDTEHQNLYTLDIPTDMDMFTGNTTLTTPAQGGESPYNFVNFTWTPVPGATRYYLEINRVSNFSPAFMVETVSVETNGYTSEILQPTANYFWRVQPYNQGYLCSTFSDVGNFSTTNMTISNEEALRVFDFRIYPNPVTTSQSVNIEWISDKYLKGMVNLYDIYGQLVHQQALSTMQNNAEIDISRLSAGLYLVSVQLETGTIQRKLMISSN